MISVCTETVGQAVAPGSALEAWLKQLPSVVAADADLLLDGGAGRSGLAALFCGKDDQVQAERAASAALTARELADRLRLTHPISNVEIFIGVNTGPIAFKRAHDGGVGAAGGALQLAEALGPSLGPGRIVTSPSAYRLVRRSFQAYGTGPLFKDGTRLPLTVYVLGARKPTVSWRNLLSSHRTPLVGRDRELRALQESWRATAHGKGQIVHVVASPGSGKSKLLDAFAQWLEQQDGSRHPIFRAWGACYGGFAYQLLADLALSKDISADPILRAITDGARSGRTSPDQMAVAASDLVAAAGGRAAVLLDDLHWADSDSLAVLTRVLPAWRAAGALVVLSYRPSLVDRWGAAEDRSGRVLELEPLSPFSARRLLAEQGGEVLPRAVQEEILVRAAGSPLYVEEAVALAKDAGSEPLVGGIPRDLFRLLLARINSWTNAQLKVLEAEAGTRFALPSDLNQRVDAVERRIEDWLDRIESGGYFERVEVGILLERLRGVDLRLRLLRWRIGTAVSLNDRLREALDRLYDAPAGDWSRAIGRYDTQSGDHAAALHQAAAAADAAARRGDHSSATELYQLAISLSNDGRRLPGLSRDYLLSKLAASLEESGQLEAAHHAYLESAHVAEKLTRLAIAMLSRAAALGARLRTVDAPKILASARSAFDVANDGSSIRLGDDAAVIEANLALAEAYLADPGDGAWWAAARRALRAAEQAPDLELAIEAACLMFSQGRGQKTRFEADLATLLNQWRENGAASVAMYLALADRPAPSGSASAARRVLTLRYRARASDLADLHFVEFPPADGKVLDSPA